MSSADLGYPGKAGDLASARHKLAAELVQALPSRSDRETMLAALRDIAKLAARWQAGISEVGPAAAAEVYDAIRGEATYPRWLGPGPAPPWYPPEQCGEV